MADVCGSFECPEHMTVSGVSGVLGRKRQTKRLFGADEWGGDIQASRSNSVASINCQDNSVF